MYVFSYWFVRTLYRLGILSFVTHVLEIFFLACLLPAFCFRIFVIQINGHLYVLLIILHFNFFHIILVMHLEFSWCMIWDRCLIPPKWLTSYPHCIYWLDWMPKYSDLLFILFPLFCPLFWHTILITRVLWYLSVSGNTRPPWLFFVLEVPWLLHWEGNLKFFYRES